MIAKSVNRKPWRLAAWVIGLLMVWLGLSWAVGIGERATRQRLAELERQPAVEDFPDRWGVRRPGWRGFGRADDRWLDILQGDIGGKLGEFPRLPGQHLWITCYINADGDDFGPWVEPPGATVEVLAVFWPSAAYVDFPSRVYHVSVHAAKGEGAGGPGKALGIVVRRGTSREQVTVTARQAKSIYSNWWRFHGGDSFIPDGALVTQVPAVASWQWLGVTCGDKLGTIRVTGLQFSPAPASFVYRPGLWKGAKAAHAAVAGWIPGRTEKRPIGCIVYLADGTHRIFSIVGKPPQVGPLTLSWKLPDEVLQRLREASQSMANQSSPRLVR